MALSVNSSDLFTYVVSVLGELNVPKCDAEVATCGGAIQVPSGVIVSKTSNNNGAIATFKCPTGQFLSGDQSITCSGSTWPAPVNAPSCSCTIEDCPVSS